MRDLEREDADRAAEEYPELVARATPFPERKIIVASTPGGDDDGTRCQDFDEDCPDVRNKLHCWFYDPCRGWCPWLRR